MAVSQEEYPSLPRKRQRQAEGGEDVNKHSPVPTDFLMQAISLCACWDSEQLMILLPGEYLYRNSIIIKVVIYQGNVFDLYQTRPRPHGIARHQPR